MASAAIIASQHRDRFITSDDTMTKQVLATHAADGREFNVKPFLRVVEEIFNLATPAIPNVKITDAVEEKSMPDDAALFEILAFIINRLSSEISYKSRIVSADAHSITISLFKMVSDYTWEAKLVLILAAFAQNYGEFWLLAQIYPFNILANRMKILKALPDMTDLKARFDAIDSLIKSIMDLSKCIVEITSLPSKYISPDNDALSSAVSTIPLYIYWICRSVVFCAAYIASLVGMGHELTTSTAEALEISTNTHKMKTMYETLRKQLSICYQQIEEKKQLEAYDALKHTFQASHVDNMNILKSLICPKDETLPLLDGSAKKRVSLDVLRRKTVLLLISGLDISKDEICILEQIYHESRAHATRLESQYEIVWIPYVDHSAPWIDDASQRQFENLQGAMPWHLVCHPGLIEPAARRFIKENWQFNKKAILVVLDPQGKVACSNAFHMMWIWGSLAFPFTSNREAALWKEEIWRLELVVDGIDPTLLDWVSRERHIMLYGGDDMEWIRRFTARARLVAKSAEIPLEMIYIGKSGKLDQVKKINAIILEEKLSHVWNDTTFVWFFWIRLESMLFSKIQLGSVDEGDFILQEVKKLLSYDKTGVWAIYSRGPKIIINGIGATVLSALQQFDEWKKDVQSKGFDAAFKEYYENLLHVADHPCCRLEFPSSVGRIPENLRCPECYRSMEKFITFSCCHGDATI